MSRPSGVMVCVPAHCVRMSQPTEEIRQFAVFPGPEQEMPMIWHQTISQNSRGMLLLGFHQDPLESRVIRILFKQRQSRHRTIQSVVHKSAGSNASYAWHARKLAFPPSTCQDKKSCVPFFQVIFRKPSRSYTPQHPSVKIQLCRRASLAPNRPTGWPLSFSVKEAITGPSCPYKGDWSWVKNYMSGIWAIPSAAPIWRSCFPPSAR